ncbi:MAG: D-amino acid dehydrogenase [Oxalicibacterium faecigallinarum]|uniref:D-amino acid dehydrogenase n=1 Tax=Oxalicibacterium faecigallinarum TaxID=573741 RepID=UPI0028096B30|nr:D-amino acid dehydrogenase [Oxalicibacterium faecigallinarum]MDQ7968815.1 D-amino acid dehydrogenase [Oxalicibacterium faecigallinarum]
MQVAVIGAGVIGVCTAYFLAEAGHDVVVMERRNHVAEEATFGDAGLLAADAVSPWAAPGMPTSVLALLHKANAPFLINKKWDTEIWRWLRQWSRECELTRYQLNRSRMHRLATYSHQLMVQLREHYQFDYEQSNGLLQLFRSEQDWQRAQTAIEFMKTAGIPHTVATKEQARAIEPALSPQTSFAGALHLPDAESGNCPLFTRYIRQLAQQLGVEFHFGCKVESIQQSHRGVMLEVDGAHYSADAVVLATGADSKKLLQPLKLALPAITHHHHAVTASVRNFESLPNQALFDDQHKVSITRLGNRIRIAGTAELGTRSAGLKNPAMHTLFQVAYDWLPDAANYNTATLWSGSSLSLPDGVPLLGATSIRNVFLNIGHGSSGWAMAAGSGKVVADIISDRATEIDMDGLTALRYQS